MGVDEVGALRTLTAHREIMDRLIGEYGGRIARSAGGSGRSAMPSRRSPSTHWILKAIGCSACCFRCGATSPEPAFTWIVQ